MLSDPNSLKFPVLFVRPRESREARDGLLDSFPFGLGGGLLDLFRGELRRKLDSSDVVEKCFELTAGIGGCSAGDCADSPYLEVFRLTTLGGEPPLPVGVETGDAR